ncbi:MAG: hypothetical protein Kow0090_20400 [Myxococcota bacterium]
METKDGICDLSSDGEEFITATRSVWTFGTESKTKIGHPAPFPKELPRRLIKFLSYKDNIVLDPFAGSGTVGIVAKELNRRFILIDNCLEYCELAKKRIAYEAPSLFQNQEIKIIQVSKHSNSELVFERKIKKLSRL